jgi:hypothetical protein
MIFLWDSKAFLNDIKAFSWNINVFSRYIITYFWLHKVFPRDIDAFSRYIMVFLYAIGVFPHPSRTFFFSLPAKHAKNAKKEGHSYATNTCVATDTDLFKIKRGSEEKKIE